MAMGTYTALLEAVANWLNRTDLSSRIPEFIAMAEARMNRDKRLRVIDAITRDTLGASAQFTTLPTDFAQMVNIERTDTPVDALTALTPQQMDAIRAQTPTGKPRYYCVIGNELELVPVPSVAESLGIIYYRRITTLDAVSRPTNWLLDAAPDIYLYAILTEASPYLHEDERAATWQAMYDQRCNEYAASSEQDQFGGAPLLVRGDVIP